jgi:hypothetical protein
MWQSRVVWVFFFVAYFAYLLLMSFYHKSSSDEGIYFYETTRIAEGLLPVRDFFAPHPILAYAPYALFVKILYPSLEAARLFSVVALLAMAGMLSRLLYREFGFRYAAVGFLLLATNKMWLFYNIQVRHSAPATLGLFTAFFLLTTENRLTLWRIFLSGAFFGLAVNSRIPLVLLGAPLLWMVVTRHSVGRTFARDNAYLQFRKIGVFVAGVISMTSVSFYLFIIDPRAFAFNLVIHRLWESRYTNEGTYSFGDMLLSRFSAPWHFATWNTQNYLVVLLPIVLLLGVLVISIIRTSQNSRNILGANATHALVIIITVGIAYGVGDSFNPTYLHHTIPFFIFVLAALMSGIGARFFVNVGAVAYVRGVSLTPSSWYLVIPFLAVIALSAGIGGYYGASQVVNRNTSPSLKRVLPQVKVACWIEANTDVGDVVLSWTGLPPAMADRQMPEGFEQAGYIGWALWDKISDQDAAAFKVVTRDEIRTQLDLAAIAIVLDDDRMADIAINNGFVDYRPLLRSRYVFYGTLSEQRIYVSPAFARSDSLSALPADPVLIPNRVRRAGSALAALPADLSHSIARLVGMNYGRRCAE